MESELRAGIAIYNAGRYHAAHDAWEGRWLGLERDTDDERLLHGLIQFTAAIHHAHTQNWVGAQGLAESASVYLKALPPQYRGVNLDTVRGYLARLRDDPEVIERSSEPELTYDGVALHLDDLDFEAAAIAARVFISESDGVEKEPLIRAIEFARADLKDGRETSPFIPLVMDIARKEEHRLIAFQRLVAHLERRVQRDDDVEGLFDESNQST